MDPATITIFVSIIGCMISVVVFVKSGSSNDSKEGERWGALDTTLKYMQSDIKEIKETVSNTQKDYKRSVQNLHERLDDHLREHHNLEVPKRIYDK